MAIQRPGRRSGSTRCAFGGVAEADAFFGSSGGGGADAAGSGRGIVSAVAAVPEDTATPGESLMEGSSGFGPRTAHAVPQAGRRRAGCGATGPGVRGRTGAGTGRRGTYDREGGDVGRCGRPTDGHGVREECRFQLT
ncbi:hypothetical protein GCM10010329_43810 [Streptomyces spiroverticillatus]|uniref:Uncharacterized protein n=1 Tax=Streptomyces finlayi TaxID=67296 RepID=A0A919CAX5_9ACTN|nr:hypothetical protein GCM10010329_43810 [Streptomyces spiroverticillatus]GHC98550.1 hypothetical protein GCM10010334_40990 [Streptomyces finlayi]